MKKVGLITYQAFTRGQGGGTRYAATIARWARDQGYQVEILARSPDGIDHETMAEGIKLVELGGRKITGWPSARLLDKDFAFAGALKERLSGSQEKYDVIHSIIPDLTSYIPERLRKKLIVSVIEDLWTTKRLVMQQVFSYYQRWQAKIALRDAAAITLPSSTAMDFFRRLSSGAGRKCRIVYDFVDEQVFLPAINQPRSPEKGLIFVPQRAIPQKMVSTALKALARLIGPFPALEMAIAGGGPKEKGLIKLAQRRGLESRVKFLGSIGTAQMVGWYQQATVVVITSASEGAQPSPTAAEAMACARPLVMTDVCDTDGVFKECVPQYRPGDDKKLAEQIKQVLENYPVANNHARQARALILNRFSLSAFLGRFAELYSKVSDL